MAQKDTSVRILCVFSRLDRGGAETMCMELYRHIDRTKVQFDFVKHTSNIGAYEEEIKALGGRVYEAPQYKVYNQISYCNWWKKHLQEHPEHKIIHGHYFTIASVYFRVCKKYNRITIGHSHSTKRMSSGGFKKKLRWMLQTLLLKKLEKRSDYCFACSTPAGKWLFPHKQFTILKNAVDTQKFVYSPSVRLEVQKELKLSDKCLAVGVVGSIYEAKNPLGIVKIFKAVHDKNPNTRLLWVGDGSMREMAESKIKEYGIQDAVILTGVRPDVHRLMQAMDVFIMPSLYEGLPVTGIEAQATGLPCLFSTNVTTEVQITDLCKFLSLDSDELWVREILNAKTERKNMSADIKKGGYDIANTAHWLQEFYLYHLKS